MFNYPALISMTAENYGGEGGVSMQYQWGKASVQSVSSVTQDKFHGASATLPVPMKHAMCRTGESVRWQRPEKPKPESWESLIQLQIGVPHKTTM